MRISTGGIEAACKNKAPFKCCGDSIEIARFKQFLSDEIILNYNEMLREKATPNPRYCSKSQCSAWIPPECITGSLGTCPKCETRTCTLCNQRHHQEGCVQDKVDSAFWSLFTEQGWKRCPNCGHSIEKTGGCRHMICAGCKYQWCWKCEQPWDNSHFCGRPAPIT